MSEQGPVEISKHRRRWPYVLIAAVVILFILNCSGIVFPMPFPDTSLRAHVKSSLDIELRASTNIMKAAFIATNDPGHYFVFELTAADRDTFVQALEKKGKDDDEARRINAAAPWAMGHAPIWWTPNQLPNVLRQDVWIPQSTSGITVYYSRESTKIFLYWFAT